MTDFEILSKVYDLLKDEKVFGSSMEEKYVEFKPPDELQEILKLKIESEGISYEETEKILQEIVRYSVKVNHKCFHNELYGGVDPCSLAAGWVTDALNNIQ